MNRLQEVQRKHEQLRHLLDDHHADTLWLRRSSNMSWITAGTDVAIDVTLETAPYSLMITREKRTVIADNIETPRIRKEDKLDDLGFDFAVSNWYATELPEMPNLISDLDRGGRARPAKAALGTGRGRAESLSGARHRYRRRARRSDPGRSARRHRMADRRAAGRRLSRARRTRHRQPDRHRRPDHQFPPSLHHRQAVRALRDGDRLYAARRIDRGGDAAGIRRRAAARTAPEAG